MKYIRCVKFNILVPFKTISVNDAQNLKRIFDSIGFDDTLFSDLSKLLTDNISYSDHEIKDMSKLITSVISTPDEINLEIDFRRLFTDSFVMSDSISTKNTSKGLSETVTCIDSFGRIVVFNRILNDIVTFEDKISSKNITKLLNDYITMVDNISLSTANGKQFDWLDISDKSLINLGKYFLDNVSTFDVITGKSSNKLLREDIIFTEQFIRVITFIRAYTDSVTISEQAFKTHISTKQDLFETYIENTRVTVGTYVDPQYYDPDYIEGITAYIKTLSDNFSIADAIILSKGNVLYSNNMNTFDLGGTIILNSYMDSQYISQNYIGTFNTF